MVQVTSVMRSLGSFRNPNAAVAISTGMRAVELCAEKIRDTHVESGYQSFKRGYTTVCFVFR